MARVQVEFLVWTIGVPTEAGQRCYREGERDELDAVVAWNLVALGYAILTNLEETHGPPNP